jgi:signal transduction histidine kinase
MAATPVKRQDEIGQLNAAFYTMTQELAKSRDEIMLRNRQLRTYATYVTGAQEEERQRIARELHDETMQLVVLLCRRLDSVQAGGETLPAGLNDRLLEARETAEQVMKELRDFTKSLRPPILDDLGIVTSVRRLLSDLEERSEMTGHLEVEGRERRLPSDTELGLFRIAQEALHNAERHSEATEINVTFTFGEDETRLEVADNGAGFSPAEAAGAFAASGRLGLTSMRERAELLGGSLEIQSSPGNGTRVIASIPVPVAEGSSA